MKRISKSISVMALCIVMLVLSVVPAFAATNIVLVEDHSVVDCVHYYKSNGNYYFQIKSPKGQIDKVSLSLINSSAGYSGGSLSMKYPLSGIFESELAYSDENYDYTWLTVKCSEYPNSIYSTWGGFGIKIFYFDGENSKMATNTSNYSTVQGVGYWLNN